MKVNWNFLVIWHLRDSGMWSLGLWSKPASWRMISCRFPSLRLCTQTYTNTLKWLCVQLLTSDPYRVLPDSLGSSAVFPPTVGLFHSCVWAEARQNILLSLFLVDDNSVWAILPFGWTVCIAATCWGRRRHECDQGDWRVCANLELAAGLCTLGFATLDTAAAPANFRSRRTHGYQPTSAHRNVCQHPSSTEQKRKQGYLSMWVARVRSVVFRKARNAGFVSLHWHTHM